MAFQTYMGASRRDSGHKPRCTTLLTSKVSQQDYGVHAKSEGSALSRRPTIRYLRDYTLFSPALVKRPAEPLRQNKRATCHSIVRHRTPMFPVLRVASWATAVRSVRQAPPDSVWCIKKDDNWMNMRRFAEAEYHLQSGSSDACTVSTSLYVFNWGTFSSGTLGYLQKPSSLSCGIY